ncbi:MAG: HAMP domain-containing histidine kinase [Nitrospirae bacterium]|nr:HAMP domain-containing histidine kinase [Candidatus Manganitrophaceae bacterium]
MNASFKRHIYRQFFTLSFLTALLLFSLFTLLYEEIEQRIVDFKVHEEIHYLAEGRNAPEIRRVETTLSVFIPSNTLHFPDMPVLFQGLPIPFFGEIKTKDKEYLVVIRQLPLGVIYVAMDTAPIEKREETFQWWLIVISVVFVGISSVLARFSTRRILKPLSELTEEIRHIDPRQRTARISEQYHDQELNTIATTFNSYLSTMENHAAREKMLISMASHELRTPIAVVSGALDVLDERKTLNQKDKKTLERIRSATSVMNGNVEGILMLARKQPVNSRTTQTLLSPLVQSVMEELSDAEPTNQIRLSIVPNKINYKVVGDPSLIQMLLRNLLQNALEHTQGNVTLMQTERGLQITDEGAGLPSNARLQLKEKMLCLTKYANESGLGLFIVTLICERLGWRIEIDEQWKKGTRIHLYFPIKQPG